MKYSNEEINKLLNFIEKEKQISAICTEMEMNALEVLGLVSYIKEQGINIAIKNAYDEISMVNMGDLEFHEKNTYNFLTDKNNEFKFIAISDTRLGSKSQQLSILNDIYLKTPDKKYGKVGRII